MAAKMTLYVVHGSHPCETVARALALKGLEHRTIELPPGMHAAVMRARFGKRTVPGLRIGRERISGSRAILRRLDEIEPHPPRLPEDPARRAKVLEAEEWGDVELQPMGRTIIWPAIGRSTEGALSLQEGARLPLPKPIARLALPAVVAIEKRLNTTDDERAREDIARLPAMLDRVDGWIAEGVLGADPPNAADLQIAPTLRLLMAVEDLRPMIAPRPAGQLAERIFGPPPGNIPAGTYPAEWVPAAA